jgi:tRNA(Phe) wybutosine-synthesizing methylase Tyw3
MKHKILIEVDENVRKFLDTIKANPLYSIREYLENLIKSSNDYLEYLDKQKDEELKERLLQEYKEKEAFGL